MKSILCLFIFTIGISARALPAQPAIFGVCIGCHGPKGESSNDLWPNLAGQKKGYLIKQLNAFVSGERKDPMMSPIAASLTEKDIQELAHYISSL